MSKLLILALGLTACVAAPPTVAQVQAQLVEDREASPPGERYVAVSFSPDGSRLALSVAGQGAIDVVRVDGGESPRRVVEAEGAGFKFSWSPDGQALVHRDGPGRLVRTGLDGARTLLHFSDGQVGFPAFDRRGELVFSTGGSLRGGRIGATIAHPGLVTVAAASAPVAAGWDGERIFTVDLESGARRDLFVGEGFFDVELSRDGRLALVRESRGRHGHLWTAATDGEKRVDLGVGWGGRLSPDGASVAFFMQENDGARFTAADLYLVDVEGRARVKLTHTRDRMEMDPAFSPDGGRLAYIDAATGQARIARLTGRQP